MAYYSSSSRRAAPRQGRQRDAALRFWGITCDDCGQDGIVGTRWKCDVCRDFDLCNDCYRSSEHSQEHAFWRIDVPETTGFKVPPRQRPTSSRRRHTLYQGDSDLQQSRRLNQGEMFPVGAAGFHCRSIFDEELTDRDRWIFQDSLQALGSIWNDIGSGISNALRGFDGHFDRYSHNAVSTFASVGDLDFAATADGETWLSTRRGYDDLQSRGGPFAGLDASYEEWQERNAVLNSDSEDPFCGAGLECECDGSGVLCAACSVASSRSMDDDHLWYHSSPNETRQSSVPRLSSTRSRVWDIYNEVRAEHEDERQRNREAHVRSSAEANTQGNLESRLRELEAIHNCVICFERRRNVVFTCGHGACATCAGNIRTCHICRQAITQRITVY